MRDPGSAVLSRHAAGQTLVQVVEQRELADGGLLDLGHPAVQLALDVARAPPGEVAETDRIEVDRVEVELHVDQRVGGDRAFLGR